MLSPSGRQGVKDGVDGGKILKCTFKQLGTNFHWFVQYIDMIFTKLNTEIREGLVLVFKLF